MNRFVTRRLATILYSMGIFALSSHVMAASFQLWEQDAASIGNYHAGYAAAAEDASTAFYNPAGIMRFKNQQGVFALIPIMPDFKFKGGVTVNTIEDGNVVLPVVAQGGRFTVLPAIHYVAPITDRIGFGFSIDIPFGLRTDYGKSTVLRYVATLSSVTVVDISPDLALALTDKAFIGVGPDFQIMRGEFDEVGTLGGEGDTNSTNRVSSTAYGYHLGALYEFTPDLRVGASFHSQVVHHLSGSSKFVGPLADGFNGGPLTAKHATVHITLPPYAALSMYYRVVPKVAIMASAIFTKWSVLQNLIMNDYAGLAAPGPDPSTSIQVIIPEHYRNTWNYSVGANFYPTDCVILRAGVGYDQTPVRNAYRNVQLPDSDRYIGALGAHLQATKTVGVDISYAHVFGKNSVVVNPPPQVTGAQITTTNGRVKGGADVFGAQIVWDMV